MTGNVIVAISNSFMTSFAALPRQIQGKVTEFLNKFRNDPTAPGFNYEKINACKDKKIWSVRIDDTYRGIVVRQPETGVYLLLWVDHHDEAYDWAANKRCDVNQNTGTIQVYDVITVPQVVIADQDSMLFAKISDKDLKELGLPEDMLPFVRSIREADDFYSKKDSFPADAFETLSWLAEGFPLDEVKDMIMQTKEDVNTSGSLADALASPETLKSFVVVDGEEELRRIMAEPLEMWRVFLHPTQRKIVKKKYSGAARVLGGAGTGKNP